MKLTILGCYGPYPKAAAACSGYLLQDGDTKILIDCGNGVLGKLFQYCNDLSKIDAIFISHFHPDHMSDLMVLRYAIHIKQLMGTLQQPIPIYLPASPQEDYDRIQYNNTFSRSIVNEGTEIFIKDIKVTFKRTDHPIECYAMAFEKGNKKFVYSADSRYFDEFVDFVRDSNLFLCEANILEEYRNENVPHMSGKQAAELAMKAEIQRLVLTHFLPDLNNNKILDEAKNVFPYILEMAEEGRCYFI